MKYLTQNKYWDIVEEYNIDKLLYLLIDKPNGNFVTYDAIMCWFNSKGQWHRECDFPAKVLKDFTIIWRKENILHRENNKPARIWISGEKEWWEYNFKKFTPS